MGCRAFFSRNIGPALVSWFLLLAISSLYLIFVCWEFSQTHGYVVIIVQFVLLFYVVSNFARATFMDPGYLPRGVPGEKIMINSKNSSPPRPLMYKIAQINGVTTRLKWCVTCEIYRLPRCSHCSICKHCIDTFDHHCPWVNNCIGRRNYRFFFLFLISLTLHMIMTFTVSLLFVLERQQNLLTIEGVIANILLILVGLIFIPIVGLTGFHIYLAFNGLTTNEQVTAKYGDNHSPFDQGPCTNCNFICCRPLGPILIRKPVTGAAMQLSLQAKYRQKMQKAHKSPRSKDANGATSHPIDRRAVTSEAQQPIVMSELVSRLDGDTSRSPNDMPLRLNTESSNSNAHSLLSDKREDLPYPGVMYQGGGSGCTASTGFSYRSATDQSDKANPAEATGRIFSCKHLSDQSQSHLASRTQLDYNPYGSAVSPRMSSNQLVAKPRQPPLVIPKTVSTLNPISLSSHLKSTCDDSPRIDAQSNRWRIQQPQISTTNYSSNSGSVIPRFPVRNASSVNQGMLIGGNSRAPAKENKRTGHYTSSYHFSAAHPQQQPPQREYRFAQQSRGATSNPTTTATIITSEEAPDGTFEISV